jgi:hypothetical protein
MSDLQSTIKSLRLVLDRGHGIVPVPHRDLRRLLDEVESLRGVPQERPTSYEVTDTKASK